MEPNAPRALRAVTPPRVTTAPADSGNVSTGSLATRPGKLARQQQQQQQQQQQFTLPVSQPSGKQPRAVTPPARIAIAADGGSVATPLRTRDVDATAAPAAAVSRSAASRARSMTADNVGKDRNGADAAKSVPLSSSSSSTPHGQVMDSSIVAIAAGSGLLARARHAMLRSQQSAERGEHSSIPGNNGSQRPRAHTPPNSSRTHPQKTSSRQPALLTSARPSSISKAAAAEAYAVSRRQQQGQIAEEVISSGGQGDLHSRRQAHISTSPSRNNQTPRRTLSAEAALVAAQHAAQEAYSVAATATAQLQEVHRFFINRGYAVFVQPHSAFKVSWYPHARGGTGGM